ncbi:hypothetical protein [Vibrio taketomensis]|uniref:hypothetical protein n=1 Tax=Vibrio taketomensis TaxID=2572923 RepID=UPI00138A2C50|nr:hypothetical protein [Vibrio taketomensis]
MSANGGIKVIDDVIGVREVTLLDHWGKRHKPIATAYRDQDEDTLLDIDKFINGSEPTVSSVLAKLSIDTYIESFPKRKFYRLKKLLPRALISIILWFRFSYKKICNIRQ